MDIDRIVAVESQQGWLIDRPELEDTLPQALQSVCRSSTEAREGAVSEARRRSGRRGRRGGGARPAGVTRSSRCSTPSGPS